MPLGNDETLISTWFIPDCILIILPVDRFPFQGHHFKWYCFTR